MATIAELIKRYAKVSHTSVVTIERSMGWTIDTIRKMTLATDKNRARVREIAEVYPDLYEKIPELRLIVGDDAINKVRDARIEGLESLVEQQKETIKALQGQVELLQKILEKGADFTASSFTQTK